MLVTQEDIEARIGRELTTDEAGRLPSLINDVTAYISRYTGRAFTKATRTKILRAQRGIINLPDRPIVSVTSIKPINALGQPGVALSSYAFDGIYKLRVYTSDYVINGPSWWDWSENGTFQTFQVEYESGYEDPPVDLVSVAENAVTNALLGAAMLGTGVSGVDRLRVGDVAYDFTDGGIGRVSSYITNEDRDILNAYRVRASTSFYEV